MFEQCNFIFGQYDFIFGQYVFMFGQYDFMREKRRLSTGDSPVERQTERGRRGMVGGCLRSSPTPQAQGPGNAWSHCTRDSARSDLWSLSWSRNDSCGPRCTPPELPPRLSRRSAHRRGRHCSVLSSAQERQRISRWTGTWHVGCRRLHRFPSCACRPRTWRGPQQQSFWPRPTISLSIPSSSPPVPTQYSSPQPYIRPPLRTSPFTCNYSAPGAPLHSSRTQAPRPLSPITPGGLSWWPPRIAAPELRGQQCDLTCPRRGRPRYRRRPCWRGRCVVGRPTMVGPTVVGPTQKQNALMNLVCPHAPRPTECYINVFILNEYSE